MAAVQRPIREALTTSGGVNLVTRDRSEEHIRAYIEARENNDTDLAAVKHQECLELTRESMLQTDLKILLEKEDRTDGAEQKLVVPGLTVTELVVAAAQLTVTSLTNTCKTVSAAVHNGVVAIGKYLHSFASDLAAIMKADGDARSKMNAAAGLVAANLLALAKEVASYIADRKHVFHYQYWKLKVFKMYIQALVLKEAIQPIIAHGLALFYLFVTLVFNRTK